MRFVQVAAILFVTVFGGGCFGSDDDSEVGKLLLLGRFEGWRITTVESDFAEAVDQAIASVPDSVFLADSITREEVRATFDERIKAVTELHDCERDDVLLITDNGVRLDLRGEVCTEAHLPHVLSGFNLTRSTADLTVTQVEFLHPDTGERSTYTVPELNDERLVLTHDRTVGATDRVPAFTYNITYRFTAP